jgi:hypothetical protein
MPALKSLPVHSSSCFVVCYTTYTVEVIIMYCNLDLTSLTPEEQYETHSYLLGMNGIELRNRMIETGKQITTLLASFNCFAPRNHGYCVELFLLQIKLNS